MPRRPRFVMPGVAHHITQRGNNRQDVFFSDQHRSRYLKILSDRCTRHELQIVGWCFMTNHIHLIAVPHAANSIALALGQAHAQYSLEVNRSRGRVGHLWHNRFFSCPLDAQHFLAAMMYVDCNPVRAGMVEDALEWPWSSARSHAGLDSDALIHPGWYEWMQQARVGWEFEPWRAALNSRLADDFAERIRRGTRLGEPCGDAEFMREMERKAGRRLKVFAPGRPSTSDSGAAERNVV